MTRSQKLYYLQPFLVSEMARLSGKFRYQTRLSWISALVVLDMIVIIDGYDRQLLWWEGGSKCHAVGRKR